jgi:type II secretory pathway pseudopilin PulG
MTLIETTVVLAILAGAAGLSAPYLADAAKNNMDRIAFIQSKIDADGRQINALQGAQYGQN